MQMFPVYGSSNIASYGYDRETRRLAIIFHKSGLYTYFDVPEEIFNDFRISSDKGKYHARCIKGKYPYKKGS